MIRLLLQVSLLVAVLGAGSTLALYRWSSEPEPLVRVMLWAALVCLAATAVSVLPLALAVRRARGYLMQACLAGTTIRLILTVVSGALVYWLVLERRQMVVFALWVLVFYLVLLGWETITSVRWVKAAWQGGQTRRQLTDDKVLTSE